MSPDYDAFGRPIRSGTGGGGGEARPSGGSGSGGGTDGPGGAGPGPGDRRSGGGSWSPSSPGSSSGGPRGSGGRPAPGQGNARGCLVALLAVVIVAIAVVGIGAAASGGGGGDEDDGGSTTPFGERSGDTAGMLSPEGTRKALDRLKGKIRPGERITSLSIREDYLSAAVATGDDAPERSLTIRSDGDDYETSSGTSSTPGMSLEAVDVAGPAKLIEATRRGLGPNSPATVSYVVLDVPREPEDEPGWAVHLEGTPSTDSRWAGDIRGEHVLRPSDGAPAPPPGDSGPARAPAGVEGASMVRPENLRRALAVVGTRLPADARVTGVDVRPDRINVRARRSFRERVYIVNAAFGLEIGAVTETTSKDGLPLRLVDPRGPERALRKIDARQGNGAPRRVAYVLLNPRSAAFPGSRTTWGVYLTGGHPNGRYWRATADGRRIGRPGEPGAP